MTTAWEKALEWAPRMQAIQGIEVTNFDTNSVLHEERAIEEFFQHLTALP